MSGQKDENQTSGIILNTNVPNQKLFEGQSKKRTHSFSGLTGLKRKSCLCCAENIAEAIQSKKTKDPLLGESNTTSTTTTV